MDKKIADILFKLLIALAFISLGWWILWNPTRKFSVSLPGTDNRGIGDTTKEKVEIGKIFQSFSASYEEMKETWPRFRGENYDNISKSPVKLLDKFPRPRD
jgi:outer membrane protein assembly factor BamB